MGKVRFMGAILLLSLIIQAINFNLEKSFFGDSAYSVFRILNEETVPVDHNRYAGSLANIPAYLSVKAGASAPTVFKLYAVGVWLVMFGVFVLLVYLKRPVEILTLALTHVWFMRESFFITTEVPTAGAFALLFSVFLWWNFNGQSSGGKGLRLFIGVLGAAGAVFSHPIGIIFLLFLLGWKFVQTFLEYRKWFYYLAPFLLVLAVRYVVFPTSSYEDSFFSKAFGDLSWIHTFRELYSVYFFFKAHNGLYLLLILLWILGLLRLNTNESRPAFLFSLAGMPALWVLLMATFREGDVNPMMEKSYLAIALPVVYIFIFRTYQLWKGIGGIAFLAMWAVSLWSLGKTIDTGNNLYTRRLEHLDRLVQEQLRTGKDKFYVEQSQIKDEIWLTHWALPFETLLMSLNKTGKGCVTVKNVPTGSNPKFLPDRFYGADFFPPPKVNSLNMRFFKLTDSEYVKLDSLSLSY